MELILRKNFISTTMLPMPLLMFFFFFLVMCDWLGNVDSLVGCWHGKVDQFWYHRGTFYVVGVIASVIYCYICWVWLIGTHFK